MNETKVIDSLENRLKEELEKIAVEIIKGNYFIESALVELTDSGVPKKEIVIQTKQSVELTAKYTGF